MIRNLRTGEVLARGEIHCKNVLSLALGLRFRRGKAAVLYQDKPRRTSLDMWFVFYPIDVLFLNDKKQVIEIKKGLQPWHAYTPSKAWTYAIEIPAYGRLNTRIHDKLKF